MVTRNLETGWDIKCICGSREFGIEEWIRSYPNIKLICIRCGNKSTINPGDFATLDAINENFEDKE